MDNVSIQNFITILVAFYIDFVVDNTSNTPLRVHKRNIFVSGHINKVYAELLFRLNLSQ